MSNEMLQACLLYSRWLVDASKVTDDDKVNILISVALLSSIKCSGRIVSWTSTSYTDCVKMFCRKCFHFVDRFICPPANNITYRVVDECLYSFWDDRSCDKEHSVRFWADLLCGLDPTILILHRLFVVCVMALLYYCLLGVSTKMLTVLMLNLISVLYSSL